MDRFEKDLSIFGVLWIIIVGLLVYTVFKPSNPNSNPAMGT